MTRRAYSDWRSEADAFLKRGYAIDLADAGISEADLRKHHRQGESPTEFIDGFALKFDLDPVSSGYFQDRPSSA